MQVAAGIGAFLSAFEIKIHHGDTPEHGENIFEAFFLLRVLRVSVVRLFL